MTSPSFEHANRILPLNPQLKSVTPRLKLSIIMVKGLSIWGYHTVIVESAEASAITL
jgi:hypothetical protein